MVVPSLKFPERVRLQHSRIGFNSAIFVPIDKCTLVSFCWGGGVFVVKGKWLPRGSSAAGFNAMNAMINSTGNYGFIGGWAGSRLRVRWLRKARPKHIHAQAGGLCALGSRPFAYLLI